MTTSCSCVSCYYHVKLSCWTHGDSPCTGQVGFVACSSGNSGSNLPHTGFSDTGAKGFWCIVVAAAGKICHMEVLWAKGFWCMAAAAVGIIYHMWGFLVFGAPIFLLCTVAAVKKLVYRRRREGDKNQLMFKDVTAKALRTVLLSCHPLHVSYFVWIMGLW